MRTYILVILAFLFIEARTLHFMQEPKLTPSWISPDGSMWTNYNPDCELACIQTGG
jgi:hypothetical protein